MIHEYLEEAWSILSHAVANHLLQSTLCVALAALLAFLLRGTGARTRYWIWFAASLKFAVPFSLLLGFGAYVSRLLPVEGRPQLIQFVDFLNQQAAPDIIPLRASPQIHSESSAAAFVLGVWLFGFLGILTCWLWRWHRIKKELRTAAPFPQGVERQAMLRLRRTVGVGSPIRLAVSSWSWTPGVFGIFNPVLLLPARVSDHLDPGQLEAILAHEMIHIRRRDNLLASLQMLVEAVFWFHPLVWWLGLKLIAERERACD